MTLPIPTIGDADRAFDIFKNLVHTAGPGIHSLTLAVHSGDGTELQQLIYSHTDRAGIEADGHAALAFCCLLAVAVTGKTANAGMVMRSVRHPQESVCGWTFDTDGDPLPLTAAAVFDAYCTDYATGQLISPQPGVDHQDAPVIHL